MEDAPAMKNPPSLVDNPDRPALTVACCCGGVCEANLALLDHGSLEIEAPRQFPLGTIIRLQIVMHHGGRVDFEALVADCRPCRMGECVEDDSRFKITLLLLGKGGLPVCGSDCIHGQDLCLPS